MSDAGEVGLSTVYIISKGRPECRTAATLERIGFPGEWFIVCGNNDEALPEYQARWGGRVLVFGWYEQVESTDPMDGYGFEGMASGACPVRNATAEISRRRGELRHWQLDDDYTGFQVFDARTGKRPKCDGEALHRAMLALARFAHACGLSNCGFPPSTIETAKEGALGVGKRVFNAHNLPSGGALFEPWRGRMNDDLINALNVWRHGGVELSVKCLAMNMPPTQSEGGGLTELYRDEGTVRKTAYAVEACPAAVRLVERFGRYHHAVDWGCVVPKIVSGRFARK